MAASACVTTWRSGVTFEALCLIIRAVQQNKIRTVL
ncbi:hypothetical protein EVAR_81705_1, partial [Eumeta japonica]